MVDEHEKVVKAVNSEFAGNPLKIINYQPKWTKGNKFSSRKESKSMITYNGGGPPRHSSLPRNTMKSPPSFLIASPSSLNKTIQQSTTSDQRNSFVGNYNFTSTRPSHDLNDASAIKNLGLSFGNFPDSLDQTLNSSVKKPRIKKKRTNQIAYFNQD